MTVEFYFLASGFIASILATTAIGLAMILAMNLSMLPVRISETNISKDTMRARKISKRVEKTVNVFTL